MLNTKPVFCQPLLKQGKDTSGEESSFVKSDFVLGVHPFLLFSRLIFTSFPLFEEIKFYHCLCVYNFTKNQKPFGVWSAFLIYLLIFQLILFYFILTSGQQAYVLMVNEEENNKAKTHRKVVIASSALAPFSLTLYFSFVE